MYFISSQNGFKYGVTDTTDKIEEFYTVKELQNFIDIGLKIKGFISCNIILIQSTSSSFLEKLEVGIPVAYKTKSDSNLKSCIYTGLDDKYNFTFAEGRTLFGFSYTFLWNHPEIVFFTDSADFDTIRDTLMHFKDNSMKVK